QVARAQEKVDEVETAGAALQPLVVLHQRPQIVAQQGRQLGAGATHERVELELRGRTTRPPRGSFGIAIAGEAGPLPVPVARQRAKLCLEAVVVTSRDLLAPRDVGDEALDGVHGTVAVVAPVVDRWGRTDASQRLHHRVDGSVAVEILMAPPGGEV